MGVFLLAGVSLRGQGGRGLPPTEAPAGPLATVLTDDLVDDQAAAEWVDGAERAVAGTAVRARLWTTTRGPLYGQLLFGAGSQAGTRSLRIGLRAPVGLGTVVVRGGGVLSVLRPGAAYPGDMGDDSQWLPAMRLVGGQSSTAEVGPDGYGVWELPAGTRTRALRFTHTAGATDTNFAGVLEGAYLLGGRFANLAPLGTVQVSQNQVAAPMLNDERFKGSTWDNGPAFHDPVTEENPAWVQLTWAQPVTLRGVALLNAGFSAGQVSWLDAGQEPAGAPERAWHAGGAFTMPSQYPSPFGIDWVDFGQSVTTRAIRLRMTGTIDEHHHPQLAGTTKNQARVWLTELMAMAPQTGQDAAPAALAAKMAPAAAPHPPIPVRFTLAQAGYVTLVVEDAQGNRVRNLVADTFFPAGENTAWWDGSDDLGRDLDAAAHGLDVIPTHLVGPGRYTVRGLVHDKIHLRYQFSVYSPGVPPWPTVDHKGGWLADHTPPSAALFVPGSAAPGWQPLVYLGSAVAESGPSLAWVTLDGRKVGDSTWVGGIWAGAPYLARDEGAGAIAGLFAYAASSAPDRDHPNARATVMLHITGLTAQGEKAMFAQPIETAAAPVDGGDGGSAPPVGPFQQITGFAVRNGVAAVSLPVAGEVLFVDLARGVALGTVAVADPRGLAFDKEGRLLALSGKAVLRFAALPAAGMLRASELAAPIALPVAGLQDPVGLTVDAGGSVYISDRGMSQQVKVFSPAGQLLRVIGEPGAPQAGIYNPHHMNNPRGMTIDGSNRLWVAEEDLQPKRVSVWTLDGKFVQAFYGGPEYGGGGALDSADATRFYYRGMELKLDWAAGGWSVQRVLYRYPLERAAWRDPVPAEPYTVQGRRYFASGFATETYAARAVVVYREKADGTVVPAAGAGNAAAWSVLSRPEFAAGLPAGTSLANSNGKDAIFFLWWDRNGDGVPEPEEVTFRKEATGGMTLQPDLTLVDAYLGGQAVAFAPVEFTAEGVPVYSVDHMRVLTEHAQAPASDGGGQVLVAGDARVFTTAPAPYARQSVGGIDGAGHGWSYPNLWPGLHPAHSAPVPDHAGELVGVTHLLGEFVTPPKSDAGPLFALNSNFGPVYLMTADGLFVDHLFEDARVGTPWKMPVAERNMLLDGVSLGEENFHPSIAQTPDGAVYLVSGRSVSLVRVDGLSSIRRITAPAVVVSPGDLEAARSFSKVAEGARQARTGTQTARIPKLGVAPGSLAAFVAAPGLPWMTINQRIETRGFAQIPKAQEAAAAVAGGRLYMAWHTGDEKLLANAGNVANAPFKSGGALDVMLGTDGGADPARAVPVAGDLRLLVCVVNGQVRATLYRAVVPGTRNPVPFSSPDRTVTFDRVEDVTSQIDFYGSQGDYAVSIPLAVLGLKPVAGMAVKADIGFLRGDGATTLQRLYWNNKGTGVVSDVPSEAELTPNLWGVWTF